MKLLLALLSGSNACWHHWHWLFHSSSTLATLTTGRGRSSAAMPLSALRAGPTGAVVGAAGVGAVGATVVAAGVGAGGATVGAAGVGTEGAATGAVVAGAASSPSSGSPSAASISARYSSTRSLLSDDLPAA